jgi:AraC-like DNA-binding protein
MKGPASMSWLLSMLDEFDIPQPKELQLGEVILPVDISPEIIGKFKEKLAENNYSIIFDRKSILAEKVKHVIYKMLSQEDLPHENYSKFISGQLYLNYTYIANVFSETQQITIEHFIIEQKIEKVKELLQNSDLSISAIADIMHYSSVGHLSNQFKKVTGTSPSEFKKQVQAQTLS